MWNRPEDEASTATPAGRPGGRAVIGGSISITGKLEGKEDLQIDGNFDGEIGLPGHQVTIGRSGRVKGQIRAKMIVVEGELRGNLDAEQQAVVRSTGRVQGDIRAPRVALEEGCQFKGNIDMEPGREGATGRPVAEAKPETGPPTDRPSASGPEAPGSRTEGSAQAGLPTASGRAREGGAGRP